MVTNQPIRQKSYILHLTLTLSELDREFFCITFLRAALLSAASPAERLRSAGSLAKTGSERGGPAL